MRSQLAEFLSLLVNSDASPMLAPSGDLGHAIAKRRLNFGLDDLTSDELADCLDEICPCGQKHSPEYLKKVRTQIKRACKRNY